MPNVDWKKELIDQLDFAWEYHFLHRMKGLTDDEYFWEPVEGCWSLRQVEGGRWHMEGGTEQPTTGPVTTIAWRMTHVTVEIFESRYRAFFGGEGPHHAPPREARQVERARDAHHFAQLFAGLVQVAVAHLVQHLAGEGGGLACRLAAEHVEVAGRDVLQRAADLGDSAEVVAGQAEALERGLV